MRSKSSELNSSAAGDSKSAGAAAVIASVQVAWPIKAFSPSSPLGGHSLLLLLLPPSIHPLVVLKRACACLPGREAIQTVAAHGVLGQAVDGVVKHLRVLAAGVRAVGSDVRLVCDGKEKR